MTDDISRVITWEELQAYGREQKKIEPKQEQKIPVVTWSWHNCDKVHKTAATVIKCSLNKYYHNGQNAHKPSIRQHGKGSWAVIKEFWSEIYYTTHNGRSNNQQHKIFDVAMFDSYESAAMFYKEVSVNCWDDNCNGGSCRDIKDSIVKVAL